MKYPADKSSTIKTYSPSPVRLAGWGLAQSLVVLAGGINLQIMTGALDAAPFLQWRQVISMLILTPLSLVLAFFILNELEHLACRSFMVFGLLLFSSFWIAVSMGIHEPINRLWFAMHLSDTHGPASITVYFLDEILSHWVFFAGYAGVCVAWAWGQARNPVSEPISPLMWMAFILVSFFGAAGIIASLWGESISGIASDLSVIAAVILSCEALRRYGGTRRTQPVTLSVQLSNLIAFAVLLISGLL